MLVAIGMSRLTPTTMTEKLDIKTPAGDLKLYFMTVQRGGVIMQVNEDVKAVMAHDDVTAINLVRKDYPVGAPISVVKRAHLNVQQILDKVKPSTDSIIMTLLEPEAPPPPKKKTVKDFVYGLMYAAEEFVTNPRDLAAIKRILKKIEYGDEAIATAEGKDA